MKNQKVFKFKMLGVLLFVALPWQMKADCINFLSNRNGADITIALDDFDKISFTDDAINVSQTNGSFFSMDYDSFWKITFETTTSGVNEINSSDQLFDIDCDKSGNYLVIAGLAPIESVYMYNIQGNLMMYASPGTETVELSIANYPAGIYIITVCGGDTINTHKLIKR